MKRRIQKGLAVSSVFLLGMATTLPSVNIVLAETVSETEVSSDEKLALPYDDLLETPTADFSTTEEQTVVEEPTFSFQQEKMSGIVGEVINVVILVDRPTNQVQVTIPKELTVALEELPERTEASQMSEEEWMFTVEGSMELSIPISSESIGEFALLIEDKVKSVILFEEESSLENQQDILENNVEDSSQEKNFEDQEKNIIEMDEKVENGIQDVSNWEEFIQAFADTSVSTINVTSDFETPDNPRQNLMGITAGATTNTNATERFVYMNVRNISRSLVIEGNGHEIDFRSITLCFYDLTATTASPWDITLKDLTIFHGNWYGPLTFNDLGETNQNASVITYHNITNYGNQMIHSPRSSVRFSGKTSSKQVREYTSSFRTWRINATDQTNIYASNVTIVENAEVELETISAGNMDLGGVSTSNNQFKMEKNSSLVATSNGNGGEAEGIALLVRRGSVDIAEGANLTLVPQTLRSAISMRSSNSMLRISEDASLSINSQGTKLNTNGNIHNIIWMAAAASLIVENGGALNIRATNMGTSSSNIIHVAGNAQVSVGKDAILDIQSDSTSNSQNLMYFASAGSSFTFADAQRVNLERTKTISGASTDNGLIHIEGSTGLLDVDIQSVKLWNRNNFEEIADYFWTPIFDMKLRYSNIVPTIISAESMSEEISNDFKQKFTTQNIQRLLLEKIPDVTITIDPLTEDPRESNSHTISGKANPNSIIHLSGDPAIPEGTLTSPNTHDTVKYHITADETGNYEYILPEGKYFKVGNEVTAKAFLNGKYNEAKTIVLEQQTPPSPVDPLDPSETVIPDVMPELPEEQGRLSIDFASQFDFGSQSISAEDKTYYAKPQNIVGEENSVNERPNYVQISDRRQVDQRNGWQLSVVQKNQFESTNEKELVGAQLRILNQRLVTAQGGDSPTLQSADILTLIPGYRQILVTADNNTGTGTWIYRFGDNESFGESIALDVPQNAHPDATNYSSSLIWELNAVPDN